MELLAGGLPAERISFTGFFSAIEGTRGSPVVLRGAGHGEIRTVVEDSHRSRVLNKGSSNCQHRTIFCGLRLFAGGFFAINQSVEIVELTRNEKIETSQTNFERSTLSMWSTGILRDPSFSMHHEFLLNRLNPQSLLKPKFRSVVQNAVV